MKQTVFFLMVAFLVVVVSCQSTQDKAVATVDAEQALSFMATNCYTCHDPKAPEDNRIAPPMIAIKRHYQDAGLDRKQFIEAIVDFVNNPTTEKVHMPGAVEKFGLMPKLPYNEDAVSNLAAYLHDNDIAQPEWFEEHYNNRNYTSKAGDLNLTNKGLQYANTTKANLGKNLMKALSSRGPVHALEFCNVHAYPITDSMAAVHGVTIKRVSDKPRNPNNAASATEASHIAYFQSLINGGKEVQPIVEKADGQVTFYAPIITNAMCLKCHGTPDKTIEPATLAKIEELYPNDKAVGYGENEVRGIWQIKWEE